MCFRLFESRVLIIVCRWLMTKYCRGRFFRATILTNATRGNKRVNKGRRKKDQKKKVLPCLFVFPTTHPARTCVHTGNISISSSLEYVCVSEREREKEVFSYLLFHSTAPTFTYGFGCHFLPLFNRNHTHRPVFIGCACGHNVATNECKPGGRQQLQQSSTLGLVLTIQQARALHAHPGHAPGG